MSAAPVAPVKDARRIDLQKHRDVALRMIANDLRRLANDIELLGAHQEIPERLVTVVASLFQALEMPLPKIEITAIISAICAAWRIRPDEIVSERRSQKIAFARQVAFYLCRELTEESFPVIARYFNRDHSTAIHGYQIIARRAAAEAPFMSLLNKLKEELRVQVATQSEAAA
jgi:chromosomal replication initiator protein